MAAQLSAKEEYTLADLTGLLALAVGPEQYGLSPIWMEHARRMVERIQQLLDSGVAHGGMRPKLRACLAALNAGVKQIQIIGAAEENSLLHACQQQETIGTVIS